jgi:8-oxo-dGTP diphosphatase
MRVRQEIQAVPRQAELTVGLPLVEVVVGLLCDADGRWLVNRRRPGTELADFWEFPGGKRASGEGRFEALRRELQEELGIELTVAEPFMELQHDYATKRVRLDVWRVQEYRGTIHGREGQALQWISLAAFGELALLDADWPIVAKLLAHEKG